MNYEALYSYRIDVFHDTRIRSNNRFSQETTKLKADTKVYSYPKDFGTITYQGTSLEDKHAPICFMDTDTITAAIMMMSSNKVGILNFASGTHPGGGVTKGSRAQEEDICRCTNLYEGLATTYCNELYYTPNKNTGKRIFLNNIIYSPDVVVFKNSSYKVITPFKVDVITCPAPACIWKNNKDAYDCYLERIECIIKVAIANHIDDLILGAWGCGAYHQNPELVSRAFVEVLSKYGGAFKTIMFAIPDMHSANYRAFKHTFNRTWLGKVEEIYCGN